MTHNSTFDLNAFINSPIHTEPTGLGGAPMMQQSSITSQNLPFGDVPLQSGQTNNFDGFFVGMGDFPGDMGAANNIIVPSGYIPSSLAGFSPAPLPRSQQWTGRSDPQLSTVSSINNIQSQAPILSDMQMLIESPMTSQELDYSARIAAQQTKQFQDAVPIVPTLPVALHRLGPLGVVLRQTGQRSLGGSISSAAVPTAQGFRRMPTNSTPALSLQERRRNARRAQAEGGLGGDTISRQHSAVASTPGYADSEVHSSGRSAKRGMNPASGRIHTPQSTKNARSAAVAAAPSSPSRSAHTKSVPGTANFAKPVGSAVPPQAEHTNSRSASASRQAYSATGFDLMGALARVVLRPNPRITLGPVDLSCSFTVCDARHPEQPIIYCSDTFLKLTGYARHEVLGRNCRFLQSPDGRVQPKTERYHTDNVAVAHMKQHSRAMQECQASLINYRKNGSPFINLVTIVPIGWGDSTDPVYLVGFQVDLVEQPAAVLERSEDGTYIVNYSAGGQSIPLPASAVETVAPALARDLDQEAAEREVTIGKELTAILGGGREEAGQWARILLQHSQDLIHVLSLKGTFLYVSPSVERLLGWKPEELIGKSISDFCHPSDVVPVFRELKDSTSNASINAAARRSFRKEGNSNRATRGGVGQGGPEVNLLMRMKHKGPGHSWIESKGKLHLEQGKGRKVVISSGRPRPVYNLPWEPVKATLDDSRPSFWAKLSQDGLILSAADGAQSVLEGFDSQSLYGKHITHLVEKKAMPALAQALRGNDIAEVTHRMWNADDEAVWVTSTFLPSARLPGTHVIPTVFVNITLSIEQDDDTHLTPNIVKTHASKPVAAGPEGHGADTVPGSSVFGELSAHRSSSHIFELHSLKHANRRLKEELRAAQRRVASKAGITSGEKVPAAVDKPSALERPTAPLKQDYVEALNKGQQFLAPSQQRKSSSSSPSGNESTEPSSGNGASRGSGTGSGSDETAATTAVSSGNNSDGGSSGASQGATGKKMSI